MSAKGKSWWWLAFVGLAGMAAGGSLVWLFVRQGGPDMETVLRLNNKGVGLMEQFDYPHAITAFEEVVQLAPDWTPGHINLGIALLNNRRPADLDRAVQIFQDILKKDDKNPQAHFCLGIIFDYRDKYAQANAHFDKVTQIDPLDPHAWYFRGKTLIEDADLEKRQEFYEKAVERDPYLRRALHGLAEILAGPDPKRAAELRKTVEGLNKIFDFEKTRYGEMGKYAEVIGRIAEAATPAAFGPLPLFERQAGFRVNLKAGVRWAKAGDLGQGSTADLRRKIRDRFGATLVTLDFNRDGKVDLFLLGAVLENNQVRDLLLRNDGHDVFTDVTHEAGLADPRPSLGCTVADFDNDGYPDLFITGAGRQWLFRNQLGLEKAPAAFFQNVTSQAGLDQLDGVCLGACLVDLDQDGDLDLVVSRYAVTAEDALALLGGLRKTTGKRSNPEVYLNVGESPAELPSKDPPPLKPAFKKIDPAAWPGEADSVTAVAATDLDGDRDLDLLVLGDGASGMAILNDRLLRFRGTSLPPGLQGLAQPRAWNGALVLDANHDGRSDWFLIGPEQRPLFLVSKPASVGEAIEKSFQSGICNSPPLLQAQAIDLDHDGWTDIVGLAEQKRPVLLHNRGGKLIHVLEGLGNNDTWPRDLVAVTAANVSPERSKFSDLLVWTEEAGLQLHRNLGNGKMALKLELSGHRRAETTGTTVRCNADGFGTWVAAQTADFWTGAEFTTLSAGLGQSRQPLVLGLGSHAQAEVVRLRWPDNCWQAELNKQACHLIRIDQTNRKPDSCPVLFTWNGQRFTFVADFLGGGTLGEALPGGGCLQPRPEESVKIEAQQLLSKDGFFFLKIAEPMNEVTYLDHLQLVVVDHPPNIRAYPDERFVLKGPKPSQDLLVFAADQEIHPLQVKDHRGRDVTQTLRHWDRDTVAGFARRAWVGFAEDHWIELDFADHLARLGPKDRLVMFLAGWTDYAYPDSIWAAHQAGIALQSPALERLGSDGQWHTLIPDTGFPAGLPRMMTVDVTGKLTGPRCLLRLRTSMNVSWDQIFIAPILESVKSQDLAGPKAPQRLVHTHVLDAKEAFLEERGMLQEYCPDGRQPAIYEHHRLEPVPVTRQKGYLTRLGDVTELLVARDDRFVILGPGDEATVKFGAQALPSLPSGWVRSYVLRTAGYCKGCGPFTITGDAIEPLPFGNMSGFPYKGEEKYPRTPWHDDYRQRFNTRLSGK